VTVSEVLTESRTVERRTKGGTVKGRKLVAALAAGAVAMAVMSMGAATARVRHQTPGISDGKVTVAGLGPSNPYKQFGGDTGAKARFELANENNEVKGITFDYTGWNDDGNSADTNLQQTQKLIQQDQVFSIVPVLTPWFIEGAKFAQQQKVPSFGWGISPGQCETKFAFGFTGCLVPQQPIKIGGATWTSLLNDYFKGKGESSGVKGKTVALIAEDNDAGHSGQVTQTAGAKSQGMKVVYSKATMPAAEGGTPVSDFTPYTSEIMTSNNGGPPDIVMEVISQNNLPGFIGALNAAGFTGLGTNAVLYSPQAAGLLKGNVIFTQFATPEAADTTPAVKTFVDAVEKVAPGEVINQPTIAAYVAADQFIKAFKAAGKNPTRASVQAAAAKTTYSLKGFVGPTKYPKGFTVGTPCGQLTFSDGTALSVGAPFKCYQNLNVKTLKPVPY
jgi:branched-chain amino acid transport system substrate-binding protein